MYPNKRPLANLANIIVKPQEKKTNLKNDPNYLKRALDSPHVDIQAKKKATIKNENDENKCSNLDTKLIENKFKTINISKCTKKSSTNVLSMKAVKNRASKQGFIDWRQFYKAPPGLPVNVIDHDKTQIEHIDSEPYYAFTIFQYLKEKELSTKCEKYMNKQTEITQKMRTVLVDWLVEVQQSFELNHETLYHGIKIMDHFLMHSNISRAHFQLLGITSIFIAAKFEERICPIIDDYIYLSDDAYEREDVIRMEIEILHVLKFDISYPLSYSFLRRFARCSSQSIETLTLARFILETSLMDYSFVDELDSKMAAAALLLAMKMKHLNWNPTLDFYTGYKESDLIVLVRRLNDLIKIKNPKHMNIRNKYSDIVFYEVANIEPLNNI